MIGTNVCLQKLLDIKFQLNSYRKLSKNVQTILERIKTTELKSLIKDFIRVII